MMRCNLKRMILCFGVLVISSWLFFLTANYFVNMRQKSILRFQIEQEMSRFELVGLASHTAILFWLLAGTWDGVWTHKTRRSKRKKREGLKTTGLTSFAVIVLHWTERFQIRGTQGVWCVVFAEADYTLDGSRDDSNDVSIMQVCGSSLCEQPAHSFSGHHIPQRGLHSLAADHHQHHKPFPSTPSA